ARHPDFQDVPTALEFAGAQRSQALIEFAQLPYMMARPFVAPPAVPADRAAALKAAFAAAHRGPQFLADAAQLKIEVDAADAEEVQRTVALIANAAPDLLDELRSVLAKRQDRNAIRDGKRRVGKAKRAHHRLVGTALRAFAHPTFASQPAG